VSPECRRHPCIVPLIELGLNASLSLSPLAPPPVKIQSPYALGSFVPTSGGTASHQLLSTPQSSQNDRDRLAERRAWSVECMVHAISRRSIVVIGRLDPPARPSDICVTGTPTHSMTASPAALGPHSFTSCL